jgi:site-specific DNA-methyltransferase (adenine-specific)
MKALTAPATDDAKRWAGWGTAMKPAWEPIICARRPLAGKTVAQNVLAYGTGALNIAATRVGNGGQLKWAEPRDMSYHGGTDSGVVEALANDTGRWPTNLLLSHGDCTDTACEPSCPVAELDRQSGDTRSAGIYNKGARGIGPKEGAASIPIDGLTSATYADGGGASRFYPIFKYEPKAPSAERPKVQRADGTWEAHPTCKPLDLIRWIARLVCPPGGTILDPFAGSGTTGEAAVIEGFRAILVEREPCGQCVGHGCPDYLSLIQQRLSKPIQPDLFGGAA